jgi:hypothetical protein
VHRVINRRHTVRRRPDRSQPTGHGPKAWLEKGPSASLFVRYVSHRISSSLTVDAVCLAEGSDPSAESHRYARACAHFAREIFPKGETIFDLKTDSARKQSRPWLADSPGGRPLRRCREMRSVYGRQRLRGTALLGPSDSRCRHRKLTRKQPFSRRECTEPVASEMRLWD